MLLTPTSQRPSADRRPSTADGQPSPPAGDGTGEEGRQARWVRPAVLVLLALTAAAYLWDLSASGTANSFYAAAVQAGSKSWKAFFFGSIDASNFITVDKPPASLWMMDLSARVFGFNSWSMLVPQVLEGVAAVGLVYATVKRWFGASAGLISGAVLALTPVAALMFRFNNPDALLVLLMVASAYTLTRAIERAGTRWIVAAGALLGFAFLAKMLQAFTVLPGFAIVYLVAAPTTLRRRVGQLLAGGVALVAAAGWWVAIVALWPVADRPMIDGSSDNSIINLILGYNGLGRLSGNGGGGGGGANFSGATGIFRLFNDVMGGQASWLIPAALVVLVAGLVACGRSVRTDRRRAALLLWGTWLVVTGLVFSFGKGVIHTYYTVALAPAIAALIGIGVALAWSNRDRFVARAVAAVAVLATAAWAFTLLDRTPTYHPWLRYAVVVGAVVSAAGLLVAHLAPGGGRRLTMGALALGLVAALSGPLAYSASTITTAHTGSIPSAGPASASSQGGPGGGGAPGGGAAGGGAPSGGGGPNGSRGVGGGAGTTGTRAGGPPSGGTRPSGTLPSGTRSTGGGGMGGETTSTALVTALKANASSYRWVAVTFGSQSAATLELSTGEAVMAIGGFSGTGGQISLATFEAYVAKGDIHYFIASSGGAGGGPGGQNSSESAITSWVTSHYQATTIGGQTVYDLTATAS